jgi:hypothetical protein
MAGMSLARGQSSAKCRFRVIDFLLKGGRDIVARGGGRAHPRALPAKRRIIIVSL